MSNSDEKNNGMKEGSCYKWLKISKRERISMKFMKSVREAQPESNMLFIVCLVGSYFVNL